MGDLSCVGLIGRVVATYLLSVRDRPPGCRSSLWDLISRPPWRVRAAGVRRAAWDVVREHRGWSPEVMQEAVDALTLGVHPA